ncbi:hypothetical protein [Paenibacillus sp. SI8]|uniref:hypothetical protein n=1 Tax=unclassified Paenibacillus TaxID=185978 RepID=UPI0034652A67
MRILVSIDDTDNLTTKGIKGTGDLAKGIAKAIESHGWGTSLRISRHQLLLHDDIPYTSHNSSMCFEADITDHHLQAVIDFSSDYLHRESERGSDPGLCVVTIEGLSRPQELIRFGYMAKQQVLTKELAYGLAHKLSIYLSEHGGSGQGVIGALAGAGLRLGGNDGSFKGKHKVGEPGEKLTVSELCALARVDLLQSLDGQPINSYDTVVLGTTIKSILSEGKAVIPVQRTETEDGSPVWTTCSKDLILQIRTAGCPSFRPDVEEEMVSDELNSCCNCYFRRWTADSFICMAAAADA